MDVQTLELVNLTYMYIEAINLCWYYVKFIREKSKMFFKWHLYASVWNSVILLVDFLSVIWLQSVFTFRWYADILKKLMPKHVFVQMHYVIATKECWISKWVFKHSLSEQDATTKKHWMLHNLWNGMVSRYMLLLYKL